MAETPDIEALAAKQWKVLEAVFDIATERDAASERKAQITAYRIERADIAKRADVTPQDCIRFTEDLIREGKLDHSGRHSYHITPKGQQEVEKRRYEKSPLAAKRKAIAWAKEGGITFSKKAAAGLGSVIISIITGLGLFAAFRDQIIRWLKAQLGMH